MTVQSNNIRQYILKQVKKHPETIATRVCEHFGVTRMTATRALQSLIREKKIIKSGKTSDTRYFLTNTKNKAINLKIDSTLDEFSVFQQYLDTSLLSLTKNQYKIFEYCCTELINNAKDHSQGSRLFLEIQWESKLVRIIIQDNGMGVFQRLKNFLHLPALQDGLLAVSKGKVTTDTQHHTGEGLFFSSRAVDRFTMEANQIAYIKDNVIDDWFYEKSLIKKGTRITLEVHFNCTREIGALFRAYMNPDTFAFDKTEILVELSKLSPTERYISRSQAKRILENLERFSRIEFDFRDIEAVGQGFVDEIFRVFKNQHPNIQLTYRHANAEVEFMIRRGVLPSI